MTERYTRPLAVITGASSGIGLELARQCHAHDFDLVLIADEPKIHDVAGQFRRSGASVYAHQFDLHTREGVERAYRAIADIDRPVDALILNAGRGEAGDFVRETDLDTELAMIDLNCKCVVHMSKLLLPHMIDRGKGRVLITSSVTATMPASLMAVYGATKAFELNFAEALRDELRSTGVTVTALQPGPTDTQFFRRASMEDRKVARQKKDDPALVARQGFDAMMKGEDKAYAGSLKNRILGLLTELLPETIKARQHRKLGERAH